MSNDKTIRDAIEGWINQLKNQDQFYQGKVISLWDNIVGPVIARETEHIYIRNKVLIVKLKSNALKYELEFAKKKLIKIINKKADHEVITDISFI
jgi:predicted nucleic acid-binding Zn ribbon protein